MEQEHNIETINKEINVARYEKENIKNLIYNIRGKQVMLDSDVAMLYQYTTKFEKGNECLRSQFATLNKNGRGQHRKYLPYVFTEQGIAMLSGLLRNEIAVQVSINIMDEFVEMRKFLVLNGQVFQEISGIKGKLLEHDKKFDQVFNELQKDKEKEFKQKIFFDGQIYDSYSLIITIIKTAKNKILIIDNYIDDSILEMLQKKNKEVEVVILTSQNSNLTKLDIQKFNKQYQTLKIAKTDKFHDRFIVIDNKELYHVGASLKDLGKKCFAISKIDDKEFIKRMNKIII